jgi:hypothetical protein
MAILSKVIKVVSLRKRWFSKGEYKGDLWKSRERTFQRKQPMQGPEAEVCLTSSRHSNHARLTGAK